MNAFAGDMVEKFCDQACDGLVLRRISLLRLFTGIKAAVRPVLLTVTAFGVFNEG